MTKRQKRLAKNELVRQENKRKMEANRDLNRRPMTGQVMMPKGPLPICKVQMQSESITTESIQKENHDDLKVCVGPSCGHAGCS
jgi:hypothetical protein